MSDKKRIIELQRQVRIARTALELIRYGHCGSRGPETVAEEALDKLFPLDAKQPLQGLVGHSDRMR